MDRLSDVLTEAVGQGTLLTVQPGGNHGDSLIYHGFDKYLRSAGIDRVGLGDGRFRYDAPRHDVTPNPVSWALWGREQWNYARHRLNDDVSAIYIHGGGNFNDLWRVGIRCYETAARYFDCPIVVGPQSCQFDETDPSELFRRVSNETHFFCRERYSYDIMQEAAEPFDHVDVYLDHDTALFLDSEDLPVDRFSEEYTLLAMRMDKDSRTPLIESDIPAPLKVNDISKMEDTYGEWIDVAARAEHIYTDRLHVAILATILDKSVTWYDTGYHKNRGVYEYSLSDAPRVTFRYPDRDVNRIPSP
jgi:exopolysaccharide biosynthesis predicted pyruvyltransferase EpsI